LVFELWFDCQFDKISEEEDLFSAEIQKITKRVSDFLHASNDGKNISQQQFFISLRNIVGKISIFEV